jgi:Helix-turn-helix domain
VGSFVFSIQIAEQMGYETAVGVVFPPCGIQNREGIMTTNQPEYITLEEAALLSELSHQTLMRYCYQGQLRYFIHQPTLRSKRTWRIDPQYFLDWIRAREFIPEKDKGFNPTQKLCCGGLL